MNGKNSVLLLLVVIGLVSLSTFSKKEDRFHSSLEFIAFPELKAPLAVWWWLRAFTAWENREWERMAALIEKIVFLEPRSPLYYEMAAWYLAWNTDTTAYLLQARLLLEQGIRCNPRSSLLYEQLGVLLRDKFHDHLAASRAFATAASLPVAHPYLRRFSAYELSACAGHEVEAYAQLKKLYAEGLAERTPALLAKIKLLEKKGSNPKNTGDHY